MEQHRNEIRRIMIFVNMIDGAYALCAKKMGIKENTLSLLYALDDGKAHSQKEICDHWLIPKTTINTVVKECVDLGYILLETGSRRKEKEIRITEKGRAFAAGILSRIYEIEQRAFEKSLGGISAEALDALEQFASCLKEETEHYTYGA